MNERPVLTMGARKLPTKADTLSVGLSLAEIIVNYVVAYLNKVNVQRNKF